MTRKYNRTMALAVAAALASPLAHADTFTTDNGLEGRWSLNTSIGTSIRMKDADKNLISVVNGGTAGAGADDGNLNFGKHDAYSTVGKLTAEFQLKGDTYGLFARGFAWYDYTLKNSNMPHGSFNNAYVPNTQLSDHGFDQLSTFDGAALADAYVFANWDVSGKPLSVKLGNQVVNWGESLFVPGINAMGAFDTSAARRPGAQVKEILRPQPALLANLGLGNGVSVEAFYDIGWRQNVVDGCGTYWSAADSLNCNNGTVLFGDGTKMDDQGQYNGKPFLAGLPPALDPLLASLGLSRSMPLNFRMTTADKIKPKNSGQFGVSGHYFADAIATDFGLYFARYHSHSPIVSVVKQPSALPSVWSGRLAQLAKAVPSLAPALGTLAVLPPGNIVWDYSGENVKTLGLSAATEAGGFSLFGEVSRTKDIPVQINAIDLLVGTALGIGPQAKLAAMARDPNVPTGTVIHGYDRKDKTQAQVSFIRQIPQVLGADSLTLLGEVAGQKWSGIGDPNTSTRYVRAFMYNFGPTAALGGTCGPAGIQPNASYCENQGYATSSAWGYRLSAELLFPNVVAGINFKPRLYFAHDVKGYSADYLFIEDRQTRSIGLRADYNNRYYADISYTSYNKSAKYDQFHDRDNMSFVIGANF
ncbi:DUF1302 family protein [Pseudoduganella eburnea]|uniref:DUF1302 family protein n=1 Tax=Massilia eburnea TaxID=1776165 RepID=A0A6L6QIS9_9BURK|nr:DUF1302 domain-containing protein [Massilia eburnea]MTW12159.1 DUF1302 family protein [Massilia eburnea]